MHSMPILPLRTRVLRSLAVLPMALWMGLTLGLRLPLPSGLAIGLGSLIAIGAQVALILHPWPKGLLPLAITFMLTLTGFLAPRPSNTRTWMPDVAQIPSGAVCENQLLIRNVRNCRYRSAQNFAVHFENRAYDLNALRTVDLFLVSWGPRHISHTILSFGFCGGEHLAFSIETRKETHESYSALRGFFREYELCVVAGDERDLIRLRTNHRKETVRLYQLTTPPEVARKLLLAYLDRINGLATHPEWYNALTDNCTTAMIGPIRGHSRRLPWSWKLIASGHLDELLYERGIISRTLPFPQLREVAVINARALAADQDPDFSARIREGLPAR